MLRLLTLKLNVDSTPFNPDFATKRTGRLDPNLDPNPWGEPLGWHKLFGPSFRFHRGILASPSRRRGLGKGTAFESLSPVVLSKSSHCSLCSQKTPSLRFENKEPTWPNREAAAC